jgi:predicted HicB family RNase H-like nuclease
MSNTMKYKGYHGSIEYSPEDECLHGRLLSITDAISYEGSSVKEIKAAFREAVDDYLAHCKEIGKQPDKPFSGKVMFRIAPKIHAKAALAAQLEGISLNQWAERALEKAAERV